jgi:hypothetical protein
MSQSMKEELVQALDRLSLDNLLAVLHFARNHVAQFIRVCRSVKTPVISTRWRPLP